MDATLERLCRLYGLETEFADIWGNRHEVTEQNLRALLRAMGVEEGDDRGALERRLRELARPLPPVLVAREAAPVRVPVALADGRELTLGWALTREDGERLEGSARVDALPRLEQGTAEPAGEARPPRAGLDLPALPAGYHRLELAAGSGERATCRLIVAPPACYLPPGMGEGRRVWGFSAQLYALRSRRGWGIGDLGDLSTLVGMCRELGADVLALSPLHALFPHEPEHASPYSPSSRLFHNWLFIDVTSLPEFESSDAARDLVRSTAFEERLRRLRAATHVDYRGVAEAKREVLALLYDEFRRRHLGPRTARAAAFEGFRRRHGEALRRQALFDAIQEHLAAEASARGERPGWGWPSWPAAYRDPASDEVARFAREHEPRVTYYEWLQWLLREQLEAAGRASSEQGLGIGLLTDLAVGMERGGAEAWSDQGVYALGASIGAPPDAFALSGQNWGLPPPIPWALVAAGYEPFAATLRAAMRHTGALRVDHVMKLMRLFWIPEGGKPADGAYVRYPLEDLLGVLALESQRNRCLVVGEDLGTVPPRLRQALAAAAVLSYRLFYFERDERGDFLPSASLEPRALAAVTTHDLPTLAGYWRGRDLREREELGQFATTEQRDGQVRDRATDRARLLLHLEREGLLPEGMTADPVCCPEMTPELSLAVHRALARSPAMVMLVALEDVLGQLDQVNLPGTSSERPNWRLRLSMDLEDLATSSRLRALAEALRAEGRPAPAPRPAARPVAAVVPRATYRLQLHRGFTFRDAAAIVPYLDRLGVSHVYASPILRARPGSTHGYDIVDHGELNPELGSPEDFEALAAALREHGMGLVLDIVPNHMGVGCDNAWWLDVLENGPASPHADTFDILWRPPRPRLWGKVVLPVLGDQYGEVLARGELRLTFDPAQGTLAVRYFDHCFPIDPGTYPAVLGTDLDGLRRRLGPDDQQAVQELESLLTAFGHLPGRDATSREALEERARDRVVHTRRLARLCERVPAIREHLTATVAAAHEPAQAGDLPPLHHLLERQAYRLAHWRVAADEVNYRRFFDINDLAGLRVERPGVFEATHRLVLDLVARGHVQGLRIDHPDGLHDPLGYFWRLQRAAAAALGGDPERVTDPAGDLPIYMVAEKILASHERLPDSWPVHGTTGYDFAALLTGLLVCAPSERQMTGIYNRFVHRKVDFDELVVERKRFIMRVALTSELAVLTNRLDQISESDPRTRDFTPAALRHALADVVACFPVYRTYVRGAEVSADDRANIVRAVAQARALSHAEDTSIYDFLQRILLLEGLEGRPGAYRRQVIDFVMRLQQYTAPVMAKGLEDTAFYIYNRLIALDEVGADPRQFGISPRVLHRANQERVERWPHSMLSTSTHDTKRGEDARARIAVLSEVPERWATHLARWARFNRSRKVRLDGAWVPGRNDEYLIYQALIGIWPAHEPISDGELEELRGRVEAMVLKAVREAKVHTSWINRNEEYERGALGFVRGLLDQPERNPFLADFLPFQRRVSFFGMLNSLSATALKLLSPGVPDIYQGNELWTYAQMDPDNRRPVDFERRRAALAEIDALERAGSRAARVRALMEHPEDGRPKLFLTRAALELRRAFAGRFRTAGYRPLETEGPRADHLFAFARVADGWAAVAVAPRWMARLAFEGDPLDPRGWEGTWVEAPFDDESLPIRCALTGEPLRARRRDGRLVLPAGDALRSFPVALLHVGSTEDSA